MKNNKYQEYIISKNDSEKRIDNILRKFLPNLPLTNIYKAIRSGDIRINHKKIKEKYKVEIDDILWIYKPLLNAKEDNKTSKSSLSISSDRIIFENNHILIYNKEAGLVIHGEKDSLDNRVKKYLTGKIEDSLSFSPGPLHRLDRNTQGLITFSKSLKGAREFSNFVKNHELKKSYITIVDGEYTKAEEFIDYMERDTRSKTSYISKKGKKAVLVFIPIISKKGKTLALIHLKTGRTHQIRVQCAHHNRPLTGDYKYNKDKSYNEYYLAAISLTFPEKSDIVNNERDIYLPLKNTKGKILNMFFSKDDIFKAEDLIKKELYKL